MSMDRSRAILHDKYARCCQCLSVTADLLHYLVANRIIDHRLKEKIKFSDGGKERCESERAEELMDILRRSTNALPILIAGLQQSALQTNRDLAAEFQLAMEAKATTISTTSEPQATPSASRVSDNSRRCPPAVRPKPASGRRSSQSTPSSSRSSSISEKASTAMSADALRTETPQQQQQQQSTSKTVPSPLPKTRLRRSSSLSMQDGGGRSGDGSSREAGIAVTASGVAIACVAAQAAGRLRVNSSPDRLSAPSKRTSTASAAAVKERVTSLGSPHHHSQSPLQSPDTSKDQRRAAIKSRTQHAYSDVDRSEPSALWRGLRIHTSPSPRRRSPSKAPVRNAVATKPPVSMNSSGAPTLDLVEEQLPRALAEVVGGLKGSQLVELGFLVEKMMHDENEGVEAEVPIASSKPHVMASVLPGTETLACCSTGECPSDEVLGRAYKQLHAALAKLPGYMIPLIARIAENMAASGAVPPEDSPLFDSLEESQSHVESWLTGICDGGRLPADFRAVGKQANADTYSIVSYADTISRDSVENDQAVRHGNGRRASVTSENTPLLSSPHSATGENPGRNASFLYLCCLRLMPARRQAQ